jgi:hypothetical protein
MERYPILLRTMIRMRRYLILIQNRIQTQNLLLHQRGLSQKEVGLN